MKFKIYRKKLPQNVQSISLMIRLFILYRRSCAVLVTLLISQNTSTKQSLYSERQNKLN